MANRVVLFAAPSRADPGEAVLVDSMQAALAAITGHHEVIGYDLLCAPRFDAPIYETRVQGHRFCTNRIAAVLALSAPAFLATPEGLVPVQARSSLAATEEAILERAADLYGPKFIEPATRLATESWLRRNRHLHYLRCILYEMARARRLEGLASELLASTHPVALGASRHALAR
jgi:hypothetical protein